MPTKINRTRSRDTTTNDPIIRNVGSFDHNESLKEPLLSRMESQESSSPSRVVCTKNCNPSSSAANTLHSRSPAVSRGSPITTIRLVSASINMMSSGDTLKAPLLASTSSGAIGGGAVVKPPINNSNNNNQKLDALWKIPQQLLSTMRHNPDAVAIGFALVAWYLVGVLAICTTKLLLSTPLDQGGVPSPLVMTFQQMSLGSLFLRTFLVIKGRVSGTGIQPWPKEAPEDAAPWTSGLPIAVDFLLLSGLFNGLDFLASNCSFSHSSASFVETIKASEPITTTALAIWWGIDRLGKLESISLTILISGVLISTYANAMAHEDTTTSATETTASPSVAAASLHDSIKTCLTVMTANLCFAFRAMAQKLLRQTPTGNSQNLDDFNLLYRMQQTGAASLLVPVLLFQHYTLLGVLFGRELPVFGYYVGLSLVNAWAFATYCVASSFILTRISVVQHSGFGCLRRLFAIVVTSIAFGVPITGLGLLGILMSVAGFAGFTHFRFQRQGQSKKSKINNNINSNKGTTVAKKTRSHSLVDTATTTTTSSCATTESGSSSSEDEV